jgi:hypothetical protein
MFEPEAVKDMFASQIIPELVLIECPDRRSRRRMEHREAVQIDGRLVMSRDISSSGLSVVMRDPLAVGDQVQVTLAASTGGSDVVTTARVVHVEKHARRAIAGLEFIQ